MIVDRQLAARLGTRAIVAYNLLPVVDSRGQSARLRRGLESDPMEHELRTACKGVIERIVQLRDSL